MIIHLAHYFFFKFLSMFLSRWSFSNLNPIEVDLSSMLSIPILNRSAVSQIELVQSSNGVNKNTPIVILAQSYYSRD